MEIPPKRLYISTTLYDVLPQNTLITMANVRVKTHNENLKNVSKELPL